MKNITIPTAILAALVLAIVVFAFSIDKIANAGGRPVWIVAPDVISAEDYNKPITITVYVSNDYTETLPFTGYVSLSRAAANLPTVSAGTRVPLNEVYCHTGAAGWCTDQWRGEIAPKSIVSYTVVTDMSYVLMSNVVYASINHPEYQGQNVIVDHYINYWAAQTSTPSANTPTPTSTSTPNQGGPTPTPVSTAVGYNGSVSIVPGWNSVAMPSQYLDYRASTLVAELVSQGIDVSSIVRWQDGRWDSYLRGVEANDYRLEFARVIRAVSPGPIYIKISNPKF